MSMSGFNCHDEELVCIVGMTRMKIKLKMRIELGMRIRRRGKG